MVVVSEHHDVKGDVEAQQSQTREVARLERRRPVVGRRNPNATHLHPALRLLAERVKQVFPAAQVCEEPIKVVAKIVRVNPPV